MFGTRATLVIDLTFCVSLLAPWVTWGSMRLARKRSFRAHRNLQLALLAIGITAVLALETSIRLAGGSLALLGASTYGKAVAARVLLGVHISGAVLTYGLWTWLAIKSWGRFGRELPGSFSARHRKIGKLVFSGLAFTAVSASAMYLVAFVL